MMVTKNVIKKQIENTLNILIDMQVNDSGRAGDLQWFTFYPANPASPIIDSNVQLLEYALHVQCAWRIVGIEGIIVASRDRYYPAGVDPYKDLENFDWDKAGNNRRDERINKFLNDRKDSPLVVLAIEADDLGSIHIRFKGGYALDIFPDDSLRGEFWRFFKRSSTDKHFVVTGDGIL